MSESTAPYTGFRITLASGILGSLGATLGWIVWLAARMASTKLLVTVLVGASIGFIVHWIKHYIHIALSEKHSVSESSHGTEGTSHAKHPFAALAWAGGFGFLGIASEDLVAHMAAEFLLPFLASLVTLLPAGMIIGYSMSCGQDKEGNPLTTLISGLFLGLAITLITGLLWSLGWGSTPWVPLFCWWGIIGIGVRVMTPQQSENVRIFDPILATAFAFAFTLVVNFLPVKKSFYENFGSIGTLAMEVRAMAAEVQQSPALPATFWMQAERNFEAEHAHRQTVALRGESSPQAPHQAPLPRAVTEHPPLNLGTRSINPETVEITPMFAQKVNLAAAVDRLANSHSSEQSEEKKVWGFWNLEAGARDEFLRSWLVIFLFALGVGLAPSVERFLRPANYPSSETFRKDITLSVVVLLTIVGSCLYASSQTHTVSQTAPHKGHEGN